MKKGLRNIISILTMVMFVNFMFSNIIFLHSHRSAGTKGVVTHSHPYSPSSSHSHSQGSLDLVAGFNTAAGAMQGSAPAALPEALATETRYLCTLYIVSQKDSAKDIPALRGPPFLSIVS